MKKVLGIDLGVGSIGWCLVEKTNDNRPIRILNTGVRIIPLKESEKDDFTKGNSITINAERTKKRTARKCYDRYQMRRYALRQLLRENNMLPSESLYLKNPMEIWQLRSDAATNGHKLGLEEIGRVLLHINQKRGYKHMRISNNDKEEKTYVQEVNAHYAHIKEIGKTVGQFFASKLKESECISSNGTFWTYRIKGQVFPRIAYEEEVEIILRNQKNFYPEVITNIFIEDIINIIFHQRKLKSCKHLVSDCEFAKRIINVNGRDKEVSRKVAPKSSPIVQLSNIYEAVNNLKIINPQKDILFISEEQRQEILNHLNNNRELRVTDLRKILNVKAKDNWLISKAIGTSLKGNVTKCEILDALVDMPKESIDALTQLNIYVKETIDKETGEIKLIVDKSIVKEPLYLLWHLVYSIEESSELRNALKKFLTKYVGDNCAIEKTLDKLCSLSFSADGYANKSVYTIREILPHLMEGHKYSEACEIAGFRHSDYLSKEENEKRQLKSKIELLKKGSLRQPVVEKVLNQMGILVNGLLEQNETIDEIRVELARDLKADKKTRKSLSKTNNVNKKRNEEIKKLLQNEYNITPTRRRIQKYILWEESGHTCMYCNQLVNVKSFLAAEDVENEHIIPKGLLFNNSMSNRVCACRKCNQKKGMRTAYDFIEQDMSEELDNYLDRIGELYDKNKISQSKYSNLTASYNSYLSHKQTGNLSEEETLLWESFVERQLRQSQYIARKAVELLQDVCRNVSVTNGCVTEYVRHIWGYDNILHDLNFNRFKIAGLTHEVGINAIGDTGKQTKEQIVNWNKRMDNRHHAVDALAIACTSQAIIQRMNSLSSCRDEMKKEVKESSVVFNEKKSLFDKWLTIQPHISTDDAKKAFGRVLISISSGIKVSVNGKRYIYKHNKKQLVQSHILVPRCQLHDEALYGCIKWYQKTKEGVTFTSEIVKKYDLAIGKQGCVFTGDETYKEKQKKDKKTGLDMLVIEDKIKKVLNNIVDAKVREKILERLNEGFTNGKDYRSDVKTALSNLKNLEERPIFIDEAKQIPIKTVRMFTHSTKAVPLRYDENGKPTVYVEPNSNHHIAFYRYSDGRVVELALTMFDAIQRKRYGLPIIIKHPSEVWNALIDREDVPAALLRGLPPDDCTYIGCCQKNDAFILNLSDDEFNKAMDENDYATLNENLYIVQNISSGQYRFRRHTEPLFDVSDMNKADRRFYNIQSIGQLFNLSPHKVNIDIWGKIKRL